MNNNSVAPLNMQNFVLTGGAVSLTTSNNVLLDGNQFTANSGGASPAGGNAFGGAVDISYSDFITVTHNTFQDNVADLGFSGGLGGALHLKSASDVLIAGNTFRHNRAGDRAGIGGALTLEGEGIKPDSAPGGLNDKLNNRVTITANRFDGNHAGLAATTDQVLLGGAMAINSTNGLTVTNNLVTNGGAVAGAALALLGWDTTYAPHDFVGLTNVANNTIVNNAGENGIYLEMWTTPITLTNNIVISHTVGIQANASPNLGPMSLEVNYTLYNGNGKDLVSDPDNHLRAVGVLTEPVQFVDWLGGDYHLQTLSPARDAGDPAGIPPAPPVDFDGVARPVGTAVDIGAFEWRGAVQYLPLVQRVVCPAYAGWLAGNAMDGYGVLLHTPDGGCSWERQGSVAAFGPDHLMDVYATDAQHAWVSGGRQILHTTDGGQSWVAQPLPAGLPGSSSVSFFTGYGPNELWALAYHNYILHTTDGGANWEIQWTFPQIITGTLSGVDTIDGVHLWVAGGNSAGLNGPENGAADGFIFASQDGGQHWTQQAGSDVVPYQPIDVAVISNTAVWVVGKAGMALRTLDGGATWQTIPVPACPFDLNRVYADASGVVWISADNGCLVGTANGLEQNPEYIKWLNPALPVESNQVWLFGVEFASRYGDPQYGWQTSLLDGHDELGYLFLTVNGGQSWVNRPLPANKGFWNLSFTPR